MRDNPKYCYISELFWSSSETLMSFKKPYLAIALVGVAAASGAAWWLQNKPAQTAEMVATSASNSGPATNAVGAPAGGPAAGGGAGGGAGGPAKPTAVEVTQVEKAQNLHLKAS